MMAKLDNPICLDCGCDTSFQDHAPGCSAAKPDIEIISQHSNQIGGVKVTFTVGRLGKRA